jgi:hypothetical protein
MKEQGTGSWRQIRDDRAIILKNGVFWYKKGPHGITSKKMAFFVTSDSKKFHHRNMNEVLSYCFFCSYCSVIGRVCKPAEWPMRSLPFVLTTVNSEQTFIEYHHREMARFQVADGGAGLQLWRIAANILNKQLQTADNGWFSHLGGLGHQLMTPRRKTELVTNIAKGLGLGGFFE